MKPVSSRQLVPAAILAALVLCLPAGPAFSGEGIVDHPDKLTYPDLSYEPPRPEQYRHVLPCGITAYIAENHEVPTFELSVLVRTGSIYQPAEKAGLAEMTAYLMRNGGAEDLSARELDERLAYLAGSISVRIDESQGRANLFCLSKDAEEGLSLLRKILKSPAFDPEALERHRADVLSELEQRNASAAGIESREWDFLLYGDHPCTNQHRRTEKSIRSLTREDLHAFHDRCFFPRNFTLAVSGDFKTEEMVGRLDAFLAGWDSPELELPALPEEIPDPAPGVYMIRKEDVNQSRVRIGHLGVKRDIPEQYALLVMNEILGGGGFTSRITRRVRSDEGLAYSTGSAFERPVLYPGTFRAWFQTKHATTAFGSRLILEEIRRMRAERCEEEALSVAKAGLLAELVNPFSTRQRMVATFADDDYTGRPDSYWREYAGRIEAVTADDVLAAARKYLHPENLVILLVGDPEAAQAGSDKHADRFSDFGEVRVLPLRDPLTLAAP